MRAPARSATGEIGPRRDRPRRGSAPAEDRPTGEIGLRPSAPTLTAKPSLIVGRASGAHLISAAKRISPDRRSRMLYISLAITRLHTSPINASRISICPQQTARCCRRTGWNASLLRMLMPVRGVRGRSSVGLRAWVISGSQLRRCRYRSRYLPPHPVPPARRRSYTLGRAPDIPARSSRSRRPRSRM